MSISLHQSPEAGQPGNAKPPRHVAIIMDGNGRWAKAQGLSRSEGHRAGTAAARNIVEECVSCGIQHLTLYTFSRENWNRPADEIAFLFDLLVDFISKELRSLEKRGVQLRILGELSELPFATRKAIGIACSRTAANKTMILNLALNYSGQEEIVRACRLYMESGAPAADLTPARLAQYLYTAGQPDPDLVIRTSGELRTSNFLPFQTAYSEFYFTQIHWPDFTPQEFHTALEHYAGRARRFGGIEAQ